MNTLSPFIHHDMDNLPGETAAPADSSSFNSPPLGKMPRAADAGTTILPPSQPDNPGVQLPPPSVSQTPHPGPESAPQGGIPYTHGTPAPGRQKNAASFLAGTTPGTMAIYMPENNRMEHDAPPQAALPAQEDDETVERLVEWREEAAY